MKYLLTGGSGLLGTEIQKHIQCYAPPRSVLEITMPGLHYCSLSEWASHETKMTDINLIVHCAAYTDVSMAEIEKELCYKTNVIGTRNLASLGIPMLYISTEYVFDGERGNYEETDYPNPCNFYGLTKLLGEYESRRTKAVVIRTLFKPNPFKHGMVCADQYTSGRYVGEISKEIVKAVGMFDSLPPIVHIGFERINMFDLAYQTRKDITPIVTDSIKAVKLPKDTSLNCSLWRSLCKT